MIKRYSWKTTTAGVLSLVMAIIAIAQKVLYGQPIEAGDITALLAGITVAIGLLTARDNDKTSDEVGATEFAADRASQELHRPPDR